MFLLEILQISFKHKPDSPNPSIFKNQVYPPQILKHFAFTAYYINDHFPYDSNEDLTLSIFPFPIREHKKYHKFQFLACFKRFSSFFLSQTQITDTLSFKFHRLKPATREITLVWLTMPSHRPLLCTFSMVRLSFTANWHVVLVWRNYSELIAFPFYRFSFHVSIVCVVKVKILLSYWEIMEWP
jgi:hypothetical protein